LINKKERKMNIDQLTIGEAKQLSAMFGGQQTSTTLPNPFIGKRVLVRTYSAGVHIGTLVAASETECHLKDALRLWKWEGGGLSLSAVAENGIVKGRLNRTPEVFLTNCIEFIPTSKASEKTFEKFVEDEK
jgi:hypothetical protein